MAYLLAEIDLDQPVPSLQLNSHQSGFGVIVRRGDRPLGYLMQPWPNGTGVSAEQLSELITQELGTRLWQDAIASHLAPDSVSMDFPAITLAVCTKDNPALLSRCLDALQTVSVSYAGSVEILVVDNASQDMRSQQVVASRPGVRYCYEPQTGLDIARNLALVEATGEFILFVDDDVVVDRYWLQGFMHVLTIHPDAAAITGLVLPLELETQAQILFELAGGFRRGVDPVRYGASLPGNQLYPCGAGIFGTGANMAFRCDVLRQLGGFDPALDTGRSLPGGGDLDLFYRVIQAGEILVYDPSFMVFHQHRRELHQLRRQYWSWGLGLMAYVVKSMQAEPTMQAKFWGLVRWWFKYQLRRMKWRLTGDYPLPLWMIGVELWGGIQGLCGAYGRSQRRIRRPQRRTVLNNQQFGGEDHRLDHSTS